VQSTAGIPATRRGPGNRPVAYRARHHPIGMPGHVLQVWFDGHTIKTTRGVGATSEAGAHCGNGDEYSFHYTNKKGHNAISSQVVWLFRASKPPCDHPKAAYFTTLPPGTTNLAKRLFIRGGAEKIDFVFSFSGGEDLVQLRGGRGDHVYYSEQDYPVERARQGPHGDTGKVMEELG